MVFVEAVYVKGSIVLDNEFIQCLLYFFMLSLQEDGEYNRKLNMIRVATSEQYKC